MNYKKILITGGSRGIGHALVEKFQNPVSEIHSVSRSQSADSGINYIQHPCDLSSLSQTKVFLENFILDHGVPDLLINNAGAGAFFEWGEFPVDEIEKQALIRGQKIPFSERLFWIVVTGAVGLAFIFLR